MSGRLGSWHGWAFGIALAVATLLPGHSYPQEGPPELRREFEELFQRLLINPGDRAANLRFIEVALLLNDTDAALGTLERLLFFTPDDPQLNFLTATIYLNQQSYVAAQFYFQRVLDIATTPAELRERAEAGLEQAREGQEGSPFSGFAQAGIRYQTNANAAPGELLGQTDVSFLEVPDFNSFALLTVYYREPVENAVLEADLTAYYADQFRVHRLDLGFGQYKAGPRLTLVSSEAGAISFKPYGLAEGILLGSDPYQRALGGGAALRTNFGDRVTFEPFFEYRDRDYFNSDDYPTAAELTGELYSYALDASAQLGENADVSTRAGLNQNDASVDDESYDEYFIDMSLRVRFDPFEAAEDMAWTFTPFAGVSWTEYAAPDPAVDPVIAREDFRWRAGARLQVPIVELFGLGLQVQYIVNQSNLDRFDYENLQLTAGPTARF